MSEQNPYNEDYFLHGKQTGVSLYENYRWLPELTRPMVRSIIDHLKIGPKEFILDFGCARGYVVKAFREFGYTAYGYDSSKWAIENGDPEVFHYLTSIAQRTVELLQDWTIAKDVLEHVHNLQDTILALFENTSKGIFVVVPLSYKDNSPYVVEDYELDKTHIHRLTLGTWAEMFMRPGWSVEARYRLKGVKDNYAKWTKGNGFITARRIDA